MSKQHTGLTAIIRAIDHSPDRSSLFWWMFDHHDAVRRAANGKRIIWAPIVAEAAALGLTDRDGKPAIPGTVRKTWYRVRQEVTRRRAAEAVAVTARGPQPSRVPASWQPPLAPPMPVSKPRTVVPAPSTTDRPSSDPYEGRSEAAKAKLAALDRQLEWRDRFLHPPKRRE